MRFLQTLSSVLPLLFLSASFYATAASDSDLASPETTQVATTATPPIPEFKNIKDISIRKRAFIRTIESHARPILHGIEKKRTILLALYLRYSAGDQLNPSEQQWIMEHARHLEIQHFDSEQPADWLVVLKQTYSIPLSLLIAQAAIESAWGTSRFAREGNNYFGIWCSQPGCGIVPRRRAEGATHEVERYPDLHTAIKKYIHILNTRSAFEPLRILRHQQRKNLLTPSGTLLLKGLKHYAQDGGSYMKLLKKIIEQNDLGQYD